MKKCVLPVLVAALLSCGNTPPADTGHDWPRWRGPNGDGVSKETDWNPKALAGGPKALWKLAIGSGYSAVVVHGNRVYTLGRDADNTTVYCVNADNGRKLWTHTYQGGFDAYGPAATPTVEEGSVYTLGSAGEIYRFDAGNGKVKWNKNLVEEYNVLKPRYGFSASPVVEEELLIVTCNSYGIALNKETGALVWTSPTTDANSQGCSMIDAYATPVIYSRNGKRYLCQFDDYGLYAAEIRTGHPSWFFSWPPEKDGSWANVADPIVFEGKAFISTGYGVGCVLLDLSSGTPSVLWQNKNMNNHLSTCVLVDGFLYGCHDPIGWGGGGILRCLDVRTGKVMWEKDFEGTVSLSAANKKLIILTERGVLVIADASPTGYNELSSARVLDEKATGRFWTPPVLCRGRIYCRSQSGELACIDMRE